MIAKFVETHDRLVHRFLESILGIMTWTLLTSPVWLGILYPEAIVYMLTYFTVYWSFMAFRHTIGMSIGYRLHKKELLVDWWDSCQKLDFSILPDKATLPASLKDVRHLLLIPAYSEPYEMVNDTINAILNQTFPTEQIVLVFTIEQKYSERLEADLRKVIEGRQDKLLKFLIYVHPAGIPGEAIGAAAANRTWGAIHALEELKNSGENIRNYIFSTIDADHILHPQYISRLTHLYLSTDRRDNHYYSTAVHLFNNNLWRVPAMMRIEANAVTLGSMSDWIVSKRALKDTFSSYSASLQTLIDANFWDVTLGVDDTIFYWRAFFARDGDFEGVPHFIPYSADAVEGKNFIDSHVRLYRQLLRWGWGAIDFPLSVKEFLKNKRIKGWIKFEWILKHIEKRVILINIVFLITFGFGIVTLVNPLVKQSNFAYSLPDIMSVILTITLVFLIPGTYYRTKLAGKPPKNYSVLKRFAVVFIEGPLIIINLLTFSFFPWIDAQTRLMLGKKMQDLYHTPKVR